MNTTMMRNRRMAEKLKKGEALSVHECEMEGDYYILPAAMDPRDHDGMDYCNSKTEEWIWSIGLRYSDGKILASHGSGFYQNPSYECIWLR